MPGNRQTAKSQTLNRVGSRQLSVVSKKRSWATEVFKAISFKILVALFISLLIKGI